MRRVILNVAVAALLLSFGATAATKPYSLEDLKALDRTGDWDELQSHLTDVPPSQRGPQWNRLLEHACLRPTGEYYQLEACAQKLDAATASEPKNRDFALRAAMFFGGTRFQFLAVPFFARVITAPNDVHCAAPELAHAVVAGLRQSAIDEDKALVAAAQTLAFRLRWPATREPIVKTFDRDGTGAYLLNTCAALKREGALSQAQDTACDREMARRR
jgi:hypothetical protein